MKPREFNKVVDDVTPFDTENGYFDSRAEIIKEQYRLVHEAAMYLAQRLSAYDDVSQPGEEKTSEEWFATAIVNQRLRDLGA